MTARAYYNEFDPFAAAWLRELIAQGLIAPGDVDERSIADVQPEDLRGYTQAHFFAGIGGWSIALRLGGWPDDRPVWTGSCPCQPFSSAGQRRGTADERHLWPEFHRLIGERRPATVFGEQVASKDGRAWLAAVRADLEALAYAVGGADLCSAGVGAPNIRQRLYWVADAHQVGLRGRPRYEAPGHRRAELDVEDHGGHGRLANAAVPRRGEQPPRAGGAHGRPAPEPGRLRDAGRLGDPGGAGRQGWRVAENVPAGRAQPASGAHGLVGEIDVGWPRAPHGFWGAADWLFCTDGRWRPVEPGTQPLAHGVPGRVGKLRGYGNAINPYVAAEFIAAFLEIEGVTA